MKIRYLFRAFKARCRDQIHEIKAAQAALRPGDCAVDVGANKGAYVYWLRRAVGSAGKVYAFEPQPRLSEYLKSIGQAMDWDNVMVRNCAVSDFQGVARLNVPGDGVSPGASLGSHVVEAGPCQSYECAVDTLDHQLAEAERVGLIKIDVEGNELAVFRGGENILRKHCPRLIFESETRHLAGHSIGEVFAFLQALDYDGWFFSPAGLRPVADFKPEAHQRQGPGRFWDAPGYCNNFLFQPRNRAGAKDFC